MQADELAKELAVALGKTELQSRLANSMIALSISLPTFESFKVACNGFGHFDDGLLQRIFDARSSQASTDAPSLTKIPEDSAYSDDSDLEQDRAWYSDEPFVVQPEDYDAPPTKRGARFNEDLTSHTCRIFVSSQLPLFLQGKNVFSGSTIKVSPVKDPNSRLAQAAKDGSEMVRSHRRQTEKSLQARDASSVHGSVLGKLIETPKDQKQSVVKVARRVRELPLTRDQVLKQRQGLPAFAMKDEILNRIRENQVVVIVGETGSGKTTQLSQFLSEDGYAKHGIIGCTQPRRVAAMSVAKRVSVEMGVQLGAEVGYSIRFENKTSDQTYIKYMTDGILLQECLTEPLLEKYSCIIIDEAHERALNTDIILGLLKRVLATRRDLKLIVTSATLNASRFSSLFGNAPQITIPGRTFAVHTSHLLLMPEDYVAASIKQVLAVHFQRGPGDILLFMTGKEDIEAVCAILDQKLTSMDNDKPLEILPIYSQLPADLQAKIFLPAPPGTRKVIVATNIAETSLTVDGIKYVIDCGLAKMKIFNSRFGVDTFQVVPISRANAQQRAGRAGRTSEGFCFRMYTKDAEENSMYGQPIPEIQRTNLANTVLLLKALHIDDIQEFDFLDPPEESSVLTSLHELWALGALGSDGKLTELGFKLSKFPMDPYMARIIVAGAQKDCLDEVLTIVSMMSVPNVFARSNERAKESDRARERFLMPESDHLSLLNVFNQWIAFGRNDKWASEHFLHSKSLHRAFETRQQLAKLVRSVLGVKTIQKARNLDDVRRCICMGYFHQAARTRGLQAYQGLRNSVQMKIHPTSALYGLGSLPEFVVYHELLLTNQQYMTIVTAVEPEWLLEDGHAYYTTEDTYLTQVTPESEVVQQKPGFKRAKTTSRPKRKFMRGV